MAKQRSPRDIATDLFVYAPLGAAWRLSKDIPTLVDEGRNKAGMTKVLGRLAVTQGRREVAQMLQRAAECLTDVSSSSAPTEAKTPPPHRPQPTTAPSGRRPQSPSTQKPSGPPSAPAFKAEQPPETEPTAGSLAIPNYTTLSATQVVAHLPGLTSEERRAIADFENATRARKTILDRIAQLDGAVGGNRAARDGDDDDNGVAAP